MSSLGSVEMLAAPVVSAMGATSPLNRSIAVDCLQIEVSSGCSPVVGIARHSADSGVAVLFSCGRLSKKVFLMLVDGFEFEFARVIARLECHDVGSRELRFGSFVEMRDSFLAESHGWVAYQVTTVEDSGATRGFPTQVSVDGQCLELLWVVPLTEGDLQVRMEGGLNALLEHFIATERDLISVSSQEAAP